MASGKTSVVLLKTVLYVVLSTTVLNFVIPILLRKACPAKQVEPTGKDLSLGVDSCDDQAISGGDLQKFSIPDPADYFPHDFVADNHLVDKVAPLIKTNTGVIEQLQLIQLKMMTTLIGKFKYAMLFNFAAFENKGDPAITVGELAMIRKLGLKLIFSCVTGCDKETIEYAKTKSKQYSTNEVVVLLHGGGNLLAYINADFDRKLVLENFPDFQVVLFPQSILHIATEDHTRLFQDVYAKHKHLTFLYRDRNSYNLGKRIFPNVKCYLMPDMAFQIGAKQRFFEPTHDIVWLRRRDKESIKYNIPANTQNYDVIIEDWLDWQTPKGSSRLEDSFLMATNGMMFLQRGRVVITDRLHGHILSVLCGIPHVVLDPVNKKITSYMQSWTGGIDNILVAHSAEDAMNKAVELLKMLDDKIPTASPFTKK